MLIEFTVENFRSIRSEQTMSLLSAKLKEYPEHCFWAEKEQKHRLLKTTFLYGANASGKSNWIRALQTFKNLVCNSTDFKLEQEIPYYEPFKLDKIHRKKPTKFELEFIAQDHVRYRYQVIFGKKEIESEELVFYPKKQEARLFTRKKGEGVKFGDYLKGKKQNIASELLPNTLFLSKAANSNQEQLKVVYLYFLNQLKILTSQDFSPDSSSLFTTKLFGEDEDSQVQELIQNFLRASDTGITSLRLNEDENSPITSHLIYEKGKTIGTVEFELNEESEGTIKLYSLAGIIIDALRKGKVLIVDELNNSLHPYISSFLVKLFHDSEKNPLNAQLIFATHDTSLLNPRTLRRDQVWFAEKNSYSATQLFSLVEFDKDEVRRNVPFGDWYLTGRFGALPFVDEGILKGIGNLDQRKMRGDGQKIKKNT